MKVKEESLKLNIQKTKIMASGPITSWEIDGETVETVAEFILGGSQITIVGDNRGWDGWMASLTWWTWVWDGDGQGGQVWGHKVLDVTKQLKNNNNNNNAYYMPDTLLTGVGQRVTPLLEITNLK